MEYYLNDNHLFTFLIILFRIGGFFLTAPILSENAVPAQLKAIISVILSFIIMTNVPVIDFNGEFTIIIIAIKELLLGLLVGWLVKLVFSSFEMAGQIVGQQGGFAIANIFDPVLASQINVMSKFLNILVFLVFLSIDGHLIVLKVVFDSFKAIPLDFNVKILMQFEFAMSVFVNIFTIAIKISAPIIVAVIVVYAALGIMAKIAPQMNLFMMSFPITLIATLFIFNYSLEGGVKVFLESLNYYIENLFINLK